MSRFSNLEFGADRPSETPQHDGEPVRDKNFFQQKAMTAWLHADFDEALQYYSRALEDDSTFYEGWFGQVRMLLELGEYPEAVIWSDKALEMFPDYHELLTAKALALVRQGKINDAQTLSDRAIAREKPTWYVWTGRAEILLTRGVQMADTCVRNALTAACTDLVIARLEAGRTLLRGKHYAEALEYLIHVARDLPTSALAWYELGRCQAALGLKEARTTLSEAQRLRPNWRAAQDEMQKLDGGFFSRLFR
jgi:tetratricopeptide (TPR) repeat protein